jgi:hypothetical protein
VENGNGATTQKKDILKLKNKERFLLRLGTKMKRSTLVRNIA